MRPALILLAFALTTGPTFAQGFTCRIGQDAACLDWGETVSSSNGMCVNANAACFEPNQCDYKGFTCKSNVDDCVEAHDKVVKEYDELLSDYEDLRAAGEELADSHGKVQRELEDLRDCLTFASTIEDAQLCTH